MPNRALKEPHGPWDEILETVKRIDERLRRSQPQKSGRSENIDLRKQAIANVIKNHPHGLKVKANAVLDLIEEIRVRNPTTHYYKPVPSWKVQTWSEMKGKNKAQVYICKIKKDSRYFP